MDWKREETAFAVALTRDCARLARRVQERLVSGALIKDDRSPVTVADFAVQALVGARLHQREPEVPLVAEESAGILRGDSEEETLHSVTEFVGEFEPGVTPDRALSWIARGESGLSGRFWVLDPVDGTKGFLRNAQYVTALALVEEGEVQLGVLGCPRLSLQRGRGPIRTEAAETGCLVVAVRGEGCWVTPLDCEEFSRLRVSDVDEPARAVGIRSVETGHTNVGQLEELMKRLGTSAAAVAVDSQAKYVLLAGGQGDFLVRLISSSNPDYQEKIWDQAPGAIVVEEAGGKISDLDGRPLDFSAGRKLTRNRGVLASNGRLHDRILEELAEVEAGTR